MIFAALIVIVFCAFAIESSLRDIARAIRENRC